MLYSKRQKQEVQLGPSEAEDQKKHKDRPHLPRLKAAPVFSLKTFWSGNFKKLILQQPLQPTDIYKGRSKIHRCILDIPQLLHTDPEISVW